MATGVMSRLYNLVFTITGIGYVTRIHNDIVSTCKDFLCILVMQVTYILLYEATMKSYSKYLGNKVKLNKGHQHPDYSLNIKNYTATTLIRLLILRH